MWWRDYGSWAGIIMTEGSEALTTWVEELKEWLYEGQAKKLVRRLRKLFREEPKNDRARKHAAKH